ncbi:MAG: CAP domain-containing protein [Meiothermus sp.]
MRPLRVLVFALVLSSNPLVFAQTRALPACASVSFGVPGTGLSPTVFLRAVNRIRATPCRCPNQAFPKALPALVWNAKLAEAALGHSRDMQRNNFFSHTGSDGSDLGIRAARAGYSWSALGENIAGGQTTMTAVLKAWLSSKSGHCEAMKGSAYTQMGAALVKGSASNTLKTYWTLDFGRPR